MPLYNISTEYKRLGMIEAELESLNLLVTVNAKLWKLFYPVYLKLNFFIPLLQENLFVVACKVLGVDFIWTYFIVQITYEVFTMSYLGVIKEKFAIDSPLYFSNVMFKLL